MPIKYSIQLNSFLKSPLNIKSSSKTSSCVSLSDIEQGEGGKSNG
jgi:hypothetical protein